MKKIPLLIFIVILISCTKSDDILGRLDDTISIDEGSHFPCSIEEIDVYKDEDCCKVEENYWLCDVLEVPEITYLDEASYNLLPNLCDDVGDSFTFSSGALQTTFRILDKRHYIKHHVPFTLCQGTHEHRVYIEQKNEIAYLDLQNDLFGTDTLHLELKSQVITYSDQTPGEKQDFFILLHPHAWSNIAHFYKIHKIGDNQEVDSWSRTFHNELELDGKTYQSVMEFKLVENVWAIPHTRLYVSDELGWFAFEKEERLWIKD